MRKVLYLGIILLLQLQCAQKRTLPINHFSLKKGSQAVLIDVRTPEEFAAGHLDKAVNINWFDTNFTRHFDTISQTDTLYVYCKKGIRSAKAASVLDSMGFTVIDLEGGYDAWAKNKP